MSQSEISEDSSFNESKLYLPKYCVVPLAVREDRSIPDAAKIYLGEINVLTNKFGYVFASDEALAEMKGVSIKTIERWNNLLEKKGYIKRETEKIHYRGDGQKGVLVRTARKIFILENQNSNISVDPSKIRGHCDPSKIRGHCDPSKMRGISKQPINKEYIKQTTGDCHHVEKFTTCSVSSFPSEKLEKKEGVFAKVENSPNEKTKPQKCDTCHFEKGHPPTCSVSSFPVEKLENSPDETTKPQIDIQSKVTNESSLKFDESAIVRQLIRSDVEWSTEEVVEAMEEMKKRNEPISNPLAYIIGIMQNRRKQNGTATKTKDKKWKKKEKKSWHPDDLMSF